MNKKYRSYINVLVWMIIVGYLSAAPPKVTNQLPAIKIPHLDKIVHFAMYFIMAFLISLAYKRSYNSFASKHQFSAILFAGIYGIAMELLQLYVWTSRSFDFFDIAANFIGASFGVIFYNRIYKIKTS